MASADPGVPALTLTLQATATSRPGSTAVRSAGRALCMEELAAWAGSFAGTMTEAVPDHGASPPPWTPVLVDRSVATVVAVQGLVWAGRRFALIDAAAPTSRIAELFARLGDPAVAVVAAGEYATALPQGVRAIPVEAVAADPANVIEPQAVPAPEPGIIIFTSGSTGRPKGVMKAWSSFERAMTTQLTMWPDGFASRPDQGHLRPLHFNGAINVAALTALGCTVELFDPTATDLDGLLERIHASGISSIGPGPALAAAMVRAAGGARRLPLVTSVTLGGAASHWELVAGLRSLAAPHVRVRAGYGATEAGNVMSYRIPPDAPILEGAVPMGRPRVPDRVRLEPLEPGSTVHQMWVRDPEAVGYLGEPELSAARFITRDDGCWWVSGDVAEIDAEGVFHHRGRVDDLVKLNGMLIEPREPEEMLRSLPGIRDAVVQAVAVTGPDGEPGRLRLVAHVCLDDPSLTPRAVREQLVARLPGPLVPSVFALHDTFPLTVNGKVDRVALRTGPVVPWGAAPHREPKAYEQVEWAVVGICRELLELPDIGVDDDLWFVGLDSLAAVELCAIVADQGFGELDPAELVDVATPAALARRLALTRVERTSDVVVFNAEGTAAPVFGIPGAGATALTFRALARGLGPDQPVVVVEAHGMHAPGRPDRTVELMATRARTEIERHLGDRAAQECVVFGHSAGTTVAYEIARQRAAAGRPTRLVLIDAAPQAGGTGLSTASTVPAVGAGDGVRGKRPRWAKTLARLRGRALAELPAIAARQARIAWYRLHAGPPRPDVLRYSSFGWRFQRAARRYQATPIGNPCTFVYVAGGASTERARQLMPQVELRLVGGDHRSCLEYPHALEVVAAIADAATATRAALISRR